MSARIVDFGTERARRFGGSTAVEQEIAEAHAEMRAAAERYGHLTSPAREWERWLGREIDAADWALIQSIMKNMEAGKAGEPEGVRKAVRWQVRCLEWRARYEARSAASKRGVETRRRNKAAKAGEHG